MVKNVLNTLRKKQKNNKGFSLVELIVVIAIMAVLVGVLAPQFIKYVEKSRQSTDLQNVEELKNAVEVEAADKEIKGDATITIKSGKATVAINFKGKDEHGNEIDVTEAPDSLGKSEVSLKSSGWGEMTFRYKADELKWEVDKIGEENAKKDAVTYNSKKPNRNMADVFSLVGKEADNK